MPDKEFLEKYPLYRKFDFKVPEYSSDIPKPRIYLYCPICKLNQTFYMSNNYGEVLTLSNLSPKGTILKAVYTCLACTKFKIEYFIRFSEKGDYIKKVGQYPPWNIKIDKNLTRILGEFSDIYKKGLICESQNFGIGAFAYYRRIIEATINKLLVSIKNLIPDDKKQEYEEALEKTKKLKNADQKIALVKDLLPSTLRPNGFNPLSILHNRLSEGLHSKSDRECIKTAEAIRDILIFLIKNVIQSDE